MSWFLELIVAWLSFDVVVIASALYLIKAIKPNFPQGWRQVVADDRPSIKGIPLDRMEAGGPLLEA
jgi:hypothetical protein